MVMVDVFGAGFNFALLLSFSLMIIAGAVGYEMWRQSIFAVVIAQAIMALILFLFFPHIVAGFG